MMNVNEAKKMTNEAREAKMQEAREEAREICEATLNERIEEAARNGHNTAFHASDMYMYDKDFYKAVKQYLEDKGYKVYQRSARVITIEW